MGQICGAASGGSPGAHGPSATSAHTEDDQFKTNGGNVEAKVRFAAPIPDVPAEGLLSTGSRGMQTSAQTGNDGHLANVLEEGEQDIVPAQMAPKGSLGDELQQSDQLPQAASANALTDKTARFSTLRPLKHVPITSRAQGAVRNKFCYHSFHEGISLESSDEALWARYEKVRLLGSGFFGEVFLAEELCLGREVAVKVFERLDQAVDGDGEADEGHLLNALGHPNLLRIFEVVETRASVHLVMEFAPGASLSSYANTVPRGGWIAGSMQQAAAAAAYCHNLGVLHGDLKPENILVSGRRSDGTPLCLVSDFGHASLCVGGRRDVASVGDPRYAAPEVQNEEGISPKSDVFMLGMTGYELLTGGWLPFFQERPEVLEREQPFSGYTMAWAMVSQGTVLGRMRKGFDHKDKQKFNKSRMKSEAEDWAPPLEAQQLIEWMVSFKEDDRPNACQVTQDKWVARSKDIFHSMSMAERTDLEYGLWAPSQARFGERLRDRAGRSQIYRLFLAAVATSLDAATSSPSPNSLFSARLLFRWMDRDCDGTLSREEFIEAAREDGLDEAIGREFFAAADIYSQGRVDFKNLCAILLDLDAFTDEELLGLLRSVVSRMIGPAPASEKAVTIPLAKLKDVLRFEHSGDKAMGSMQSEARTNLDKAAGRLEETLGKLGVSELSLDILLGLLRGDSL